MPLSLNRFVICLLLAVGLVPALQAQTQLRDYYVVEVILFSNDLSAYANEENWPEAPNLSVPDKLRFPANIGIDKVYPELSALLNGGTAQAANSPYLPLLGAQYVEHKNAANRIQRTSRHRLLAHMSWLQKIEDEGTATPVAILAGENVNGFYEFAGSIKLHRSRYIHVQTDLWRSYFIKEGSDNVALPIMLPKITPPHVAQDSAAATDADNTTSDEMLLQKMANLLDSEVLPDQPAVSRVATLQQKRRMRSREIHHIDHPLMGIIIEVRPFEP